MGLFDKFKKKETNGWENAYKANPQFYAKDDGKPFGAFALTEGTETILPKSPNYAVDGNAITEYRLMLVSTTKDAVIGDVDYSVALSKLESYKLDENDNSILLRGLSLNEMEGLIKTEEKESLKTHNLGGCIITKSLCEGTSKLKWIFREEGVNPADNGWRAIGDTDTEEYINTPGNNMVVDFDRLVEIEPAVLAIYDMPVGTDLEFDSQRRAFIDSNTGKEYR